ncbi:MAG: hypothetical protein ACI9F9_002832 [Candidatus Paceibacteria bacterium]|jgi:hypothetical protein
MARSRPRKNEGGRKDTESRAPKAKSRKAPAQAEVEVVEEAGGMTIDDGIPIITSLLLIAAFLCVDYALGMQYGEGMFFK